MLRGAFEQGRLDIDPDDDQLAAQLGSLKVSSQQPRPGQAREQRRHAQAWDTVTRPGRRPGYGLEAGKLDAD